MRGPLLLRGVPPPSRARGDSLLSFSPFHSSPSCSSSSPSFLVLLLLVRFPSRVGGVAAAICSMGKTIAPSLPLSFHLFSLFFFHSLLIFLFFFSLLFIILFGKLFFLYAFQAEEKKEHPSCSCSAS